MVPWYNSVPRSTLTKWQLMLPTGRPKSSLHIVYLWYDAGRVRTCHSGYEPGDGHACLCRRNTLRFRTRSARRYTICCEKCGRTPPISWHLKLPFGHHVSGPSLSWLHYFRLQTSLSLSLTTVRIYYPPTLVGCEVNGKELYM